MASYGFREWVEGSACPRSSGDVKLFGPGESWSKSPSYRNVASPDINSWARITGALLCISSYIEAECVIAVPAVWCAMVFSTPVLDKNPDITLWQMGGGLRCKRASRPRWSHYHKAEHFKGRQWIAWIHAWSNRWHGGSSSWRFLMKSGMGWPAIGIWVRNDKGTTSQYLTVPSYCS